MIDRRTLLQHGLVGIAAVAWLPALAAHAAPPDDRRLRDRLELWRTFSSRTDTLVARYVSTRTSALLVEPLVMSGTLVAPSLDELVLRDDDSRGAHTRIRADGITVQPLRKDAPLRTLGTTARAAPTRAWLGEKWLATFASADAERLTDDAEVRVPKGAIPRLELRPRTGSVIGRALRSMLVQLDPVGGAVVRVVLTESQGDTFELSLADHRQNVDAEALQRALGEAR
jgi:hypothetical protein